MPVSRLVSSRLVQNHFLSTLIVCAMTFFMWPVLGCQAPVNRNQEFDTAYARVTDVGTLYAPFGGQTVSATYYGETGPRTINNVVVYPSGSQAPVSGVTSTSNSTQYSASYTNWPTNYIADDMYMPALWTVNFTPTQPCFDPGTPPTATPPYPLAPTTQSSVQELDPGVGVGGYFFVVAQAPAPHPVQFKCFVNTLANPSISPTGVSPRFVLDDALPPTVQVAALSQINAAPQNTFLHLFSTDLQQFTQTAASAVDPSGMSATFPYPTGAYGAPLPAGGYIGTITTDVPGQPETTNAMEPMVIAHDNQSYPGAFGVAYIQPKTVTTTTTISSIRGGECNGRMTTQTVTDGISGPVVSSVTQNSILLPNNTSIGVGMNPTVVLALNYVHDSDFEQPDDCTTIRTQNSGPQSVLVLNTGSASVSVVQVGDEDFPAGTIPVGNQPVAAVVGSGSFAYVSNYADGTISEIDTTNLIQTRVLPVMAHPTSLSFDSSGNLWVGGQGFVDEVSIANWTITGSTPVDGTVSQMAYSAPQNSMVQTLLQNGTTSSPSLGRTMTAAISYSTGQSSYSTVNLMNAANASSSGPTVIANSNTSYVQSPVAQYLAFPAQTAFVPAVLSSSGLPSLPLSSTSGDVVAVANGNTFTVFYLPSGDQLLGGTLPYPIRGVTVGGSSIYFTMTESNSVVSFPTNF